MTSKDPGIDNKRITAESRSMRAGREDLREFACEILEEVEVSCGVVNNSTWKFVDPDDIEPLVKLAMTADDKRDPDRWHYRCGKHSTYFYVGDECPYTHTLKVGDQFTTYSRFAEALVEAGKAKIIPMPSQSVVVS